MSLVIFDKKYKCISNLFVEKDNSNTTKCINFVYPYPLEVYGTIENEEKNTKNNLDLTFSSYYDSILIIDSYFSLFFYLLDFDYTITTMYFRNIIKNKSNSEINGYKGSYNFTNDNIILNISEDEVENEYNKIKTNI